MHRVARYLYREWCAAAPGDRVLCSEQYRALRDGCAFVRRLEVLLAHRCNRAEPEARAALLLDENTRRLEALVSEARASGLPLDVQARVSELELAARGAGSARSDVLAEERSLHWELCAPAAALRLSREFRSLRARLCSGLINPPDPLVYLFSPLSTTQTEDLLKPTALPSSVKLEHELLALSASVAAADHSTSIADLIALHRTAYWEAFFQQASQTLLGPADPRAPLREPAFELSLNDHYLHFFQTLW